MREEIVAKVAEQMGLPVEEVDKIFMFQFKLVKECTTSPDYNYIYIPYIGSFKFRPHKAAYAIDSLEYLVGRFKQQLETEQDLRKIKDLINKIDDYEADAEMLKGKASFVNNKYDGIRTKIDDKRLSRFKGGRYVEFINKLRSERYKEDLDK